MDERAAPERDTVEVQHPAAPPGWADAQESLSAASGLSVLLVEGPQPPALIVSNNNSICQAFQSSPEHRHLCDPYCGAAFDRAMSAKGLTHYRCHAGLHCVAAPINLEKGRSLAVIGGRAFLTSADYRALAERFRTGDLQDLLSEDLFKNVIFAARQDLDDLIGRLATSVEEYRTYTQALAVEHRSHTPMKSSSVEHDDDQALMEQPPLLAQDDLPLAGSLQECCARVVETLAAKYGLDSAALLLCQRDVLVPAFCNGRFKKSSLHVTVGARDRRLLQALKERTSLAVRGGAEGYGPMGRASTSSATRRSQTPIELFPFAIGGEVKGALLADAKLTDAHRRAIHAFCQEAALPLEVLRLREELERREGVVDNLQSFVERINEVEPAETYVSILNHLTELLSAERGSLLLFDEASNELAVRAALGLRAEVMSEARVRLGDGVSGAVMRDGRPLVVRDLESAGRQPAPPERLYKTRSFISYPLTIGGRKVGVLNVTDKAGGGTYDEIDLRLLESIAPQMALALDRAEWREKAAQFQLMSITDPLTSLLNRRYLEERLMEELNRSKRYDYAMSFMMIDIDDFKLYNDRNGHQAGDLALEMTAQCLKSALRSADVAARYGGEEFCILLPQTTLAEANIIAERIRRRVERTRYPHGKTQPLGAVTVSIGLSSFSEEVDTPATIIGAADRALYIAKSRGKNRVQSKEGAATDSQTSDAAEDTI